MCYLQEVCGHGHSEREKQLTVLKCSTAVSQVWKRLNN